MAETILKKIREESGLTLAELGVKAHVSATTIIKLEKGGGAHRRTKAKLAMALRIPLTKLFPEAGDGSPK